MRVCVCVEGGWVVERERERDVFLQSSTLFRAESDLCLCASALVCVCVWCRTLPPVRKKARYVTCIISLRAFVLRRRHELLHLADTLGPGDGSAAASPPALTEKRTHRAGRMPVTSRQMLSLIGTTCLWLPLLAEVCSRHPPR